MPDLQNNISLFKKGETETPTQLDFVGLQSFSCLALLALFRYFIFANEVYENQYFKVLRNKTKFCTAGITGLLTGVILMKTVKKGHISLEKSKEKN